MHSALSVLALLLAADKTPAPVKAPAEPLVPVVALSVEVDYVCRERKTESLVLTPRAHGQLKVPAGCPDAGADWRLTVDCTQPERCTGTVRTSQGAIARVTGSAKQLELRPFAQEHPPTLDFMALRITGQDTLMLKAAEEHQRPVQLLLQHPAVTGVYTLSPAERIPVAFESQGKRLLLKAHVSWSDEERVHLRLHDAEDVLLFDDTLRLEEPRALDCKRLKGFCQGTLKLLVRENQPLPYH
ncbi:hypothetical protein [Melittangium boletus]|uniref:hypothetical protein n=1 Tax=Melittangium boletus TaxID=83453 RepID=UPI003DA52F6C